MVPPLRVFIAFALSALFHVVLFVGLALIPESQPVPVNPESAEEEALEVTLVQTPQESAPSAEAELVALAKKRGTLVEIGRTHAKIADKEKKGADAKASPSSVPEPTVASATVAPTPSPKEESDAKEAESAWNKAMSNAVFSCWDSYRLSKKEVLGVGEVRLKFSVDAQGKVSDISVLSNTANPTNADYAIRSVKEANIPPIPPERLARMGQDQRVVIENSFLIF